MKLHTTREMLGGGLIHKIPTRDSWFVIGNLDRRLKYKKDVPYKNAKWSEPGICVCQKFCEKLVNADVYLCIL